MKRGKSYDWIPLWIDKWLMGSTRFELEPAERSVFIDFMVMAAKDDGFIRANVEMGYPLEYLAQTLNVPADILLSTIDKCIKFKKLDKKKNGIFYIKNWKPYSLSSRHKRRLVSEYPDMLSAKADTTSAKVDGCLCISLCIIFNFKSSSWEGIGEGDIAKWQEAYPACDIKIELARMREWILSNKQKGKKSNWRRFITNWLSRTQDRGGTKGGAAPTSQKGTWLDRTKVEDP